MKTISFILIFLCFQIVTKAQIAPVNFLDTSFETAGISKIISFDIDNDGSNEIITSTTGTLGRIGYYQNLTNSTFSSFNLIESFAFCRGIAVGDFNNDNWKDIVSIGGINSDSKIHLNNSGTYSSGTTLDVNNPTQLNDVVVADFDQNNSDDIVIIGQHSIDFYRNNGDGSFSKEIILSTSTSPLQLECLDIDAKDMDNDGDIDLICGETAGLVIYINDGNGVFTPNYYSILPEVVFVIHTFDIDNDGDIDVVGRNGAGDVKWFCNNGSAVMTFESTLANIPNLISMSSVDYNNDGFEDLFISYTNKISIFLNNDSHSFEEELSVYQNNNLVMGVVGVAELNNQPVIDLVWSGGNNTIAYLIMPLPLVTAEVKAEVGYSYPNPSNGIVNFSKPMHKVIVFNSLGEKIFELSNVNSVDLSSYSSGVYLLILEDDINTIYQKIIKQ
jgi:hypothetical protein